MHVDPDKLQRRLVKVCPVILREANGQREILVFRHPLAGVQLVKGTLELAESVADGALRELAEESGIAEARTTHYLGKWIASYQAQEWHFLLCQTPQLPEKWSFFTQDEGGLLFEFFWHPLDDSPGDDWHNMFVEALLKIRSGLLVTRESLQTVV